MYGGWKRRCGAYEVIVYIERRYLVMIVRWIGNHASTCGSVGEGELWRAAGCTLVIAVSSYTKECSIARGRACGVARGSN